MVRKFLTLLFLVVVQSVALRGKVSAREVCPINDNWRFFFRYENTSDAARPVTLPHTWNRDALNGSLLYRRTTADYLRDLYIPAGWKEKRLFLRFYGVQNVADIFINGEHAGEHRGGSTAFTVEITDKVRFGYNNSLHVMVSNDLQNDIFPLSTDQNTYGGICREVELIATGQTAITPDYYGADGVLVSQFSVDREAADGAVAVHLTSTEAQKGQQCHVQVSIMAPDGYKVVTKSVKAKLDGKPVTIPFTIPKPVLWSPADAHLYTVEVVAASDTVTVTTGFRSVEVSDADRLRINGKRFDVRGVTLAHDRFPNANALTHSDIDEDLTLLRDMGANAVRSAAAPHPQYLYDCCDRQGVPVWIDFPLVQAPFPSDVAYIPSERLRENGRQQVREIIAQNYNHPSVIMWGVFSLLNGRNNEVMEYLREINDIAKRLDPSRPTVACSNRDGEINFITDLIVWQQDLGWDRGDVSDIGLWLSMLTQKWSHLRQAVTYGPYSATGISESVSAAKALEQRYSPYEIRLRRFHEDYLEMFAETDLFWGVWLNQMFDYGASRYLTGIRDGGMVSLDRKTRHDLYYLYRSVWNTSSPTLHICTESRYDPTAAEHFVEFYSSAENPLLKINGEEAEVVRTGRTRYRSEGVKMQGRCTVEVQAGEAVERREITVGIDAKY